MGGDSAMMNSMNIKPGCDFGDEEKSNGGPRTC